MVVLHVTLRVKREHLSEFLEVARYNAERATADEPGCVQFDIIQDRDDPSCFRFYEVYRDDAALATHRETPHFKRYIEATPQWLTAPAERHLGCLIDDDDDE
ncbi:MAG TPA: putative quinol monooxygenase [Vicinamibacterales bacterium]